jgi:hypothetical protein
MMPKHSNHHLQYVPVATYAKAAGIGIRAAYMRVRAGYVKAIRIGAHRLAVPVEEIDRLPELDEPRLRRAPSASARENAATV